MNCHDLKAAAIQIAFSGAFASFLFTEVASLISQNSHFLEILIQQVFTLQVNFIDQFTKEGIGPCKPGTCKFISIVLVK